MSDFDQVQVAATLNIPASTSQIQKDLQTIEKNLRPIKISAQLNTENIKSQTNQIQQQISQAIKIAPEKVNLGANIDLSSLTKSGTTIRELSDKVALLAQQMQILQARAESAGVTLNQVQVGKFTDLLNNFKIPEATTYLKQLRNEYSLLNVEMSKDLPETAIENMNSRVQKLSETISQITAKFSQVHLDNQPGFANQVNKANTSVSQLKANLDAYNRTAVGQDKVAAFNKLNQSVAEAKVQVNDLFKAQKDLDRLSATSNRFEAFLNDNIKVSKQFPEAVAKIRSELQSLNTETDMTKLNSGLQNVRGQISAFEAQAKSAGATGRTIFGELGNDIKKMFTWTVGGTLIFGTVNQIKQMAQNVKSLDEALVNIQMATGDTREAASKLMDTYNQMGKQLGATTVDVANSADSFLRQGKSLADTNTLIKDSMVLSKVGEIDSAQATEYLTSSMKGYGIATNDAIGIVDKLSKVDIESATSAGGLAEAMSKVANVANLSGVSMDKLIGYLATVGEVTQKSMDEVGTSFQSIFSRMGNVKAGKFVDDETGESLNDVESVLKKIGISLRDSQGQFRNFGDVLDEIGSKWKSYNSVEQNAITTSIAGTRNRENATVLFQNYATALKYSADAANSSGTAMEKMQNYEEGLEAKTNRATAAFEQLSKAIINGNAFGGLIDTGTGFLNVLTSIISKLGILPTLLTAISAGSSLFGKNAGKLYAPFLKVA